MGRGTSKAGGGNSKNVATSLLTPWGTTVDLSDNPIVYGANDSALSGDIRNTIEEFENRVANDDHENMLILDKDGNVIAEIAGGQTGVTFDDKLLKHAVYVSHNHPRIESEMGDIGGTFSLKDFNNCFLYSDSVQSMSASAYEGKYRISKGNNFDKTGFANYIHTEYAGIDRRFRKDIGALQAKINRGEIQYSDATKIADKMLNDCLIKSHNSLMQNCKKYGVNYTLEKGGK